MFHSGLFLTPLNPLDSFGASQKIFHDDYLHTINQQKLPVSSTDIAYAKI